MTTDDLPGLREASLARVVETMRELGVDEASFDGDKVVSIKLGRAPLREDAAEADPEARKAKALATLYGSSGTRR